MKWLYGSIIILTFLGVAAGRIPRFRMNRAAMALIGATLLIALGAIPLDRAYGAVDGNTLVLLFSMMVLNANLRLSGFFDLIGMNVTRLARTPRQLLALIVISSGVLSAVFLNDTIVLMFTPLVIGVTRSLGRNPVPYLIALMTSANIASAATLTGNPQNMLIGMASGIPYSQFTARMAPAALTGLGVCFILVLILYPGEFAREKLPPPGGARVRFLRPLLIKSLIATGGMIAAFLLGAPIALASLSAAAFLLFTRRVKPQRVFREIDFTLLVFFAGLFVVTGALETTGLSDALFARLQPFARRGAPALAGAGLLLSNLISNVPAVLLFRPLIPAFPSPREAWLVLSLSTTFAGNLTLLGSVANLIVAESARSRGVSLSFGEYLRAGVPVTLASLILGMAVLFV